MSLPEDVVADIKSAMAKLTNAINAKTVADQQWGEWDLVLDQLADLLND